MTTDCTCGDREVAALMARYAQCLDNRDWAGLETVFVPEVTARYGGREIEGFDGLVAWIRLFLDGCGPSQHLLGFVSTDLAGDRGTAETQVRVIHRGAGERADLVPYESIGSYHDELVRTADGWRINRRVFDVRIETGDRAILAPPTTTRSL